MEQRQSFCFERHVATSQLVVDRRTFSKAKKISWVVLLTTGRGAPWYDDEGERRWKSLKQLSEQKGGTRRPSTVMYLPLFESTAAYTSLLTQFHHRSHLKKAMRRHVCWSTPPARRYVCTWHYPNPIIVCAKCISLTHNADVLAS